MSNTMPESFVVKDSAKSYAVDGSVNNVSEDLDQKELNRRHNTLIVDSLFSNEAFTKIYKDLIDSDVVKKRENTLSYSVAALFAALSFVPFTSSYISFFSVFICFLLYSMFFSGIVVKLWRKYHVWRFKNYFKSKENLLSFFDSMIDNRYLNNRAFKETNVHALYNLITSSPQSNQTLDFYFSNFAVKSAEYNAIDDILEREKHIQYLKSWFYLQEWIEADTDKNLTAFMKETGTYLSVKIKQGAIHSPTLSKRDLMEQVFNQIGKNK